MFYLVEKFQEPLNWNDDVRNGLFLLNPQWEDLKQNESFSPQVQDKMKNIPRYFLPLHFLLYEILIAKNIIY